MTDVAVLKPFHPFLVDVLLGAIVAGCVAFAVGGCKSAEVQAGHNLGQGLGEYMDSPEGQAKIDAGSRRATAAAVAQAKDEVRAEVKAEIEDAKKAAANGTASWWQILLLAAAGYPVGRTVRVKLWKMFGFGGNGNGNGSTNGGAA